MIITEIELVNHVVLGDIKCNTLGNDINSIIGRNGSGKSLLMSCLHPYSTSSRLDFVYPIKSGVSGYKRIVYSDGVKTYEIMHEYTPKNERHSCKSYINMIEDGKVTELNPTGHNDLFKTLVKKHLNYDNDVSSVCYISTNNNGLISSSSKRRREIMSTIIESDKLNSMVKNVTELVRDTTAGIKILDGSKTQLLSVNGWKDKNSLDLSVVEEKIQISDIRIAELTKELEATNKSMSELGKIDSSDLNILSFLAEITDSRVFDVVSRFKATQSEFAIQDKYIKELTDKLSTIKEKQAMRNRNIVIQKEIESYETELVYIVNNLNKKIKIEDVGEIHRVFRDIASIQELKSKLSIIVSDIKSEHKLLSDKLDEIKSFISHYDNIKSDAVNVDGCDVFDKLTDKCDDCYLYKKLYKNSEYIKTNESKYNQSREEAEVLTYNIDIISKILMYDDVKLGQDISNVFCESFIKDFNICAYTDTRFEEIEESLIQNISRKSQLESKLTELRIQLSSSIVDTNTDFDSQVSEVESNLNDIKETYKNNLSFIKSIYNVEERFGVKLIETPQKFMDYTIAQIKSSVETIRRYETIQKGYFDKKASLENQLSFETNSNKKLKEDLIKYKVALERINDIETELKEKRLERDEYLNCKDILTKDIPIHMLSSVINFIITSVNTILANNKINLSIDIEITDDNDIIIPVYTEKSNVPDVSAVSSGEACLISLLINAAMVHLLKYPILYIDEIDANLDEPNRVLFSKIVVSIMSVFKIDQIFCISHNISSDIISATKFLVGSDDGLNVGEEVIHLHKE